LSRKGLFLSAFLFLAILVSSVVAGSILVYGQVSTVPTEVWYDVTRYYSFNFTVHSSNATWVGGEIIPVLVNVSLLQAPPEKDAMLNFTGYVNEDPSNLIPIGSFVVTQVLVEPPPDWFAQIGAFIALLGSVTAGIVDVIVALIKTTTGYEVPAFVVTAILATLFVLMIKKYWKVLGLFFIFLLAFLAVSGGAYALKLLFWG